MKSTAAASEGSTHGADHGRLHHLTVHCAHDCDSQKARAKVLPSFSASGVCILHSVILSVRLDQHQERRFQSRELVRQSAFDAHKKQDCLRSKTMAAVTEAPTKVIDRLKLEVLTLDKEMR
jgi:hypothetical protein